MPTAPQTHDITFTEDSLRALLRALGPGWRRAEPLSIWPPTAKDWVELRYDDTAPGMAPGAGLYLSIDPGVLCTAQRLTVSGITSGPEHCNMVNVLPYGSPHRQALTASITLSLAKAPARLAREIWQRFAERYLAAWNAAYTCYQEQQTQQQDLNTYMADLAAILQTDRLTPAPRDAEACIDVYAPHGVSATFRASHTKYVRVEALTLNRQQALELAALIASWKGSPHA